MRINVTRIKSTNDATLSTIDIDGEFQCFGLEDEYRENKVPAETRIPAGIYFVELRKEGGFHTRYKAKFDFHEGMLQVMDVPNFEYILIHIGNTDEDTAGCLLVGVGARSGDDLTIQSSTTAYREFYPKVLAAIEAGETVTIRYIDGDQS